MISVDFKSLALKLSPKTRREERRNFTGKRHTFGNLKLAETIDFVVKLICRVSVITAE